MLHMPRSRQFWPGNISPGHCSSGPILKPRRWEEILGLERVVIYCCGYLLLLQDREWSPGLFLCGCAHEVTHCEFGSTCVWRTLWSEAEGCRWLATSHGFGWQLPLMCSIPSQCGREVPVWSSKRTVGLRKICSSQACLNRRALAGLGEGRGALPLPCQQRLWGVMAPMSYILLFCRQQFWSDVNIDLDIKDQILWPWDLYQLFPSQPH